MPRSLWVSKTSFRTVYQITKKNFHGGDTQPNQAIGDAKRFGDHSESFGDHSESFGDHSERVGEHSKWDAEKVWGNDGKQEVKKRKNDSNSEDFSRIFRALMNKKNLKFLNQF